MSEIIFHIDVNSAYLSWSALKLLNEGSTIDIRTVPAIVGGDQETRHGIVVAKSIPAKAYGIETAETVASAFKKCPNLMAVMPDHHYYKVCSDRLMQHLKKFGDEIEQVSIDECFMNYDSLKMHFDSPIEAACFIKDSVKETFGFTVNIGISDRKVLAKMASDFEKPDKVHTLYTSECAKKLWPLPIKRLHMCGNSSAALFEKMGIRTIGELAATDKKLVSQWLKKHGVMLWEYANGIDRSKVLTEERQVKGVGNSTTLSKDVQSEKEAGAILKKLSISVSERLKKKHLTAGCVTTEIKYATFMTVSHQMTLEYQTNDAKEIYRYAYQLFCELWDGTPIRLLGVRTTKLEDLTEPVQLNLFDFQKELEQAEKKEKLNQAILSIKNRFGEDAIKKGEDFT